MDIRQDSAMESANDNLENQIEICCDTEAVSTIPAAMTDFHNDMILFDYFPLDVQNMETFDNYLLPAVLLVNLDEPEAVSVMDYATETPMEVVAETPMEVVAETPMEEVDSDPQTSDSDSPNSDSSDSDTKLIIQIEDEELAELRNRPSDRPPIDLPPLPTEEDILLELRQFDFFKIIIPILGNLHRAVNKSLVIQFHRKLELNERSLKRRFQILQNNLLLRTSPSSLRLRSNSESQTSARHESFIIASSHRLPGFDPISEAEMHYIQNAFFNWQRGTREKKWLAKETQSAQLSRSRTRSVPTSRTLSNSIPMTKLLSDIELLRLGTAFQVIPKILPESFTGFPVLPPPGQQMTIASLRDLCAHVFVTINETVDNHNRRVKSFTDYFDAIVNFNPSKDTLADLKETIPGTTTDSNANRHTHHQRATGRVPNRCKIGVKNQSPTRSKERQEPEYCRKYLNAILKNTQLIPWLVFHYAIAILEYRRNIKNKANNKCLIWLKSMLRHFALKHKALRDKLEDLLHLEQVDIEIRKEVLRILADVDLYFLIAIFAHHMLVMSVRLNRMEIRRVLPYLTLFRNNLFNPESRNFIELIRMT